MPVTDYRRDYVDPLAGILQTSNVSNEGSAVPVVYGQQTVEMKLIGIGPGAAGEWSRMWWAICHGKITALALTTKAGVFGGTNSQVQGHFDYFYDGDPILSPAYIPRPPDEWLSEQRSVYNPTLTFHIAPLPGIAHCATTYASDFFNSLELELEAMTADSSPPPLQLTVRRDLSGSSPFANWKVEHTDVGPSWGGIVDYGDNPAAVIYDLMTNTMYGLSVNPDDIDLPSFQTAADYFDDQRYGINLVIKQLGVVRSVISKVEANVGCQLIPNDSGK